MLENQHKRSIDDDVGRLKDLMPWIGGMPLRHAFTWARCSLGLRTGARQGVSIGTINHGLQVVRRILNLAAGEWMDEQGLTWLQAAPKIKLLAEPRPASALSAELG